MTPLRLALLIQLLAVDLLTFDGAVVVFLALMITGAIHGLIHRRFRRQAHG